MCLTLLLLFFHSSNNYDEYRNYCKEKYHLSIAFPDSSINFTYQNLTFEFGNEDASHTAPIFEGGAVVQLSNHCSIVLEDFEASRRPPISEQDKKFGEDRESVFEGILRNNCGLAWQDWYARTKKEKRKEEKWNASKYTQVVSDSNLKMRFNANEIIIFNLPNYKKITCWNDSFDRDMKKYNCCYGIELRHTEAPPVMILCFINQKSKKQINDYLYDLSRYLHFYTPEETGVVSS